MWLVRSPQTFPSLKCQRVLARIIRVYFQNHPGGVQHTDVKTDLARGGAAPTMRARLLITPTSLSLLHESTLSMMARLRRDPEAPHSVRFENAFS